MIDLTEISSNSSHSHFWQETVQWLMTNRDAITDDECEMILSWAMHEYTELNRTGERQFSWKGRNARTVVENSIEYRRMVEIPYLFYKWRSHNWDCVFDEPAQKRWSFLELTSGEQLFWEGKAMKHCVGSYAGRCASGYSAIVSLQLNDIRRVTIEINLQTLQIVQARGSYNREADKEEIQIINRWKSSVVRQLKSDSIFSIFLGSVA